MIHDIIGKVEFAPLTYTENLTMCALIILGLLGIFGFVSLVLLIFRDDINEVLK